MFTSKRCDRCFLRDGRRCVRYKCNTLNIALDVLDQRPGWVEAKEWVGQPCWSWSFLFRYRCTSKATCRVCLLGTKTGTSSGAIWPGSGKIWITCTWMNTWEWTISGTSMRWGSLHELGAVQIWANPALFSVSFWLTVQLCRKNLMVKNLKRHRKNLEKDFGCTEASKCDFFPRTFVLPSEYHLCLEEFKRTLGSTWIMKPVR